MNKVLSIGAKVLAGAVLCGALVYYNFCEKVEVNENARCVGEESFDFTIDLFGKADGKFTAEGEEFTLSESRGKVVVLNFWATWCTPCKEEIPHFNEFYEERKDEVEMVIINTEPEFGATDMANNYLNNSVGEVLYEGWTDFTCKFGRYEKDNDVSKLFLVVSPSTGEKNVWQSLPLTVILDQEGVIRYSAQGAMSKEALEEQVNRLL